MDWALIMAEIDFGSVLTAIGALVVALAGVYIAWKGGKIILSALR